MLFHVPPIRRHLLQLSMIPLYALIASSTSFVCTFFLFGLFLPATLPRFSRFTPFWSSPPCALDQCTSVDSQVRPVCYILSVSPSVLHPGTCGFAHTLVRRRPRGSDNDLSRSPIICAGTLRDTTYSTWVTLDPDALVLPILSFHAGTLGCEPFPTRVPHFSRRTPCPFNRLFIQPVYLLCSSLYIQHLLLLLAHICSSAVIMYLCQTLTLRLRHPLFYTPPSVPLFGTFAG